MRVLALLLALSFVAWPQVAGSANRRYQTKDGRERLAAGLGSSARDQTQNPAGIVAALELRPGMAVADVGTGVGYMLPFLSQAVLAALAGALKPNGHLAIVEFYKANSPEPGHIRLDRDEVIQEVERNGFRLLSKNDRITATQYLLTFAKK